MWNVNSGKNFVYVEMVGIWELYFLLNFAVNLKLLLKNKVCSFKKNAHECPLAKNEVDSRPFLTKM